jgi:hypothetical protein
MPKPVLQPSPDSAVADEWTVLDAIAFRFASALAVLSLPRVAIFIPPHLVFESLRRPIAFIAGRADVWLRQYTGTIGAFLIRALTGGRASVGEMTATFKSDWYAAAVPDLIGILTLAVLIAALWTTLDRRRTDYAFLNRWLRVYLRYALATAMFSYAFIKVIPTQFGYLTPGELLRPLGQLSRFRMLWDFMAASPGYTIFAGVLELFGALLLFFRGTTLLGAIVLAGALINVIAMDFAFRVGAVTYALSLLIIDFIILAPYAKPLMEILIVQGSGTLPAEPSWPRGWWRSPVAKAVLILVLALPLIAINVQRRRYFYGAGNPVYGLFEVASFVRNGHITTPSASDGAAWKRVASDPHDGVDAILVQFANGDLRRFDIINDPIRHVWSIRQSDARQSGTLEYRARPDGVVSLSGRLGDDSVDILLRPVDLEKTLPLLGGA